MRLAVAMVLVAACSVEPVPLVEGHGWEEGVRDPLPSHRPDSAPCEPSGWGPELGGVEVDTAACPYANLTQAALVEAKKGSTLAIHWWHQDLFAVEPAQGHVALFAEDDLLWETWVDIPADASAFAESVPLSHGFPADTPITLHLHNHGTNTWNVHSIEVLR